ncbi:MAG: FHA domain-containing protein, partial [Angustibacter sp.]
LPRPRTAGDGPPPLISSVPWRRSASDDDEPAAAPVTPPAPPAPVPVQQVSLPTRPEPVAPAVEPAPPTAQPASPPPEPRPADDSDELDELDEATVDRAALLAQRPVTGPEVLAVLCPAGHPSPAHATRCRVCGRDVPAQTPYRTPRPPLGVLTLSTGDVVTLDRGVLLGRAPTLAGNASLGERPHVVKVASPDKDISRNHAQFALEGWHVLVSDLGSTNGTTVQLPGQEPVRLRPGDQQSIEPGTVVVLADEVSLVYEVTP